MQNDFLQHLPVVLVISRLTTGSSCTAAVHPLMQQVQSKVQVQRWCLVVVLIFVSAVPADSDKQCYAAPVGRGADGVGAMA
jgi:hypothetical protein